MEDQVPVPANGVQLGQVRVGPRLRVEVHPQVAVHLLGQVELHQALGQREQQVFELVPELQEPPLPVLGLLDLLGEGNHFRLEGQRHRPALVTVAFVEQEVEVLPVHGGEHVVQVLIILVVSGSLASAWFVWLL